MITENNYRYNSGIYKKSFYGRMINGQAVSYVSGMRYGICNMSFNGCEVIAVHNALVYMKKARPVYEVSRYMERFRMLAGFFGCNPHKIGNALGHFGIKYKKSRQIGNSEIFIVSFWTGRRFLSTIHTVFCIRSNNTILVFNRYNNYPDVSFCMNDMQIANHKEIIAVYTIKGV
ncbi:MAG: hypothetical protein K2J39_03170 [Ruminococcus sp.]|nr:hypothetical protein [Ruminococcus sp.]